MRVEIDRSSMTVMITGEGTIAEANAQAASHARKWDKRYTMPPLEFSPSSEGASLKAPWRFARPADGAKLFDDVESDADDH